MRITLFAGLADASMLAQPYDSNSPGSLQVKPPGPQTRCPGQLLRGPHRPRGGLWSLTATGSEGSEGTSDVAGRGEAGCLRGPCGVTLFRT